MNPAHDEPTRTDDHGNVSYRNSAGELHRVGGPAVVWPGARHEEWWLDGRQVTRDQAIAAQAWDEGYRATGYEPSHGENPYKPCTCCQEMTDTNNTTP